MCQMSDLLTASGVVIEVACVKKNHIERMIAYAEKCRLIDSIVLFGSALEDSCTTQSDIDVAIVIDESISKFSKDKSFQEFKRNLYQEDMNQEYDFLYFRSLEEIRKESERVPVCKELCEKGKIIYQKKAG